MPLKTAIFAAAALIAGAAGAHPNIYTYLDANGVRHYTDVPDNNRYKLLSMSSLDLTESGDHYNPALLARATRYDAIIENAAVSSALEANLLRAVIVVESGFNSRAVSKRGAVGLMQLMPTPPRIDSASSNLYDPKQNVRLPTSAPVPQVSDGPGFGQNVRLALAAYNAGEDAVERNGGQIPPFTETMAYVPRVLKVYRMFIEQPRST